MANIITLCEDLVRAKQDVTNAREKLHEYIMNNVEEALNRHWIKIDYQAVINQVCR